MRSDVSSGRAKGGGPKARDKLIDEVGTEERHVNGGM